MVRHALRLRLMKLDLGQQSSFSVITQSWQCWQIWHICVLVLISFTYLDISVYFIHNN